MAGWTGFLLDSYLPLFLVREDHSLENIDVAIDAAPGFNSQGLLSRSKVFQGGNWAHLHRLLGLSSGSQLMYVGDHMYSDILRSKRTLGWRTVLIIPELDTEVREMELAEESRRHVQVPRHAPPRANGRCPRMRAAAPPSPPSLPAPAVLSSPLSPPLAVPEESRPHARRPLHSRCPAIPATTRGP